jgi:hypothetical protein
MMASSFLQIRLFVEGFYDKKFVERILAPRLSERYAVVQIHEYARAADETLRNHFKSLTRMPDTCFFILADYDMGPCLSAKRQALQHRFEPLLQPEQILIVRQEIESWYLAGVPAENHFKVEIPNNVETVSEEKFRDLFATWCKRYRTNYAILRDEILEIYDWDLALQRSPSLLYCAKRLGLV